METIHFKTVDPVSQDLLRETHKSLSLVFDITHLLAPPSILLAVETLAIAAQGIAPIKPLRLKRDGAMFNLETFFASLLGDLAASFACPLESGNGIASGRIFQ